MRLPAPPRVAALVTAALLSTLRPAPAAPAAPTAAVTPPDTTPLTAHRLRAEVRLDGRSDEAAWRGVRPLPVVAQVPRFGAAPSQRTEILLAYDDTHLYLAGRFFDTQPEAIQATTMKRDDDEAGGSDAFGIVIDTFDDNENALVFVTTPTGSRLDLTVSGDAQRNGDVNASWNTFWDVATARTDSGWFAEVRIPFSSLRFQARDGQVVMGFLLYRWIARRDERVVFPAVPLSWGDLSYLKPSQARAVVFTGLHEHRPAQVTPYVLGGVERTAALAVDGGRYRQDRDRVLEAGVDAKVGLTSNVTLDLTANTDFAQVEADDQQINLTRYPLFYPEKRRFFLERASTFEFRFYRDNTLFHSRRIGIEAGRPVPLYGGARIVGRVGPWDLGLLSLQSEADDGLPSTNFGVLRLRRQVGNPYSYAGGIVTTKIGDDGSYNAAYGLDGTWRVVGDDYLKVNWAQTFRDGDDGNAASMRRAKVRVHWERYRYTGWAYGLNVSRSGADYDPALGYEKYPDNTSVIHFVRYGWDAPAASVFFQQGFYEDVWLHLRNADDRLESRLSRVGWFFSTKAGHSGHVNVAQNREDVDAPLRFADGAGVPVGDYTFYDAYASLSSPEGGLWSWEATLRGGGFYDGGRGSLELTTGRSLSRHLEVDATWQVDRVDFGDRGQDFTSHIGRLRALLMVDARTSLSAFVQASSAADRLVANLRLRYNPREGTDLYVVYDEGLNLDRRRQAPPLPRSGSRALFVKAYTTVLR